MCLSVHACAREHTHTNTHTQLDSVGVGRRVEGTESVIETKVNGIQSPR